MLNFSSPISSNSDSIKNDLFAMFEELNMSEENFFTILSDISLLEPIESLAQKFSHKKHLVQVGLGGSALGPQMLFEAFKYETDRLQIGVFLVMLGFSCWKVIMLFRLRPLWALLFLLLLCVILTGIAASF